MKKKVLMIIVLIAIIVCGMWKITGYVEFKNNQENLYNWIQSFSSEDIEEIMEEK